MATKKSTASAPGHLHIRVEPAAKVRFQRACKRAGREQSDVLRKLMAAYSSGDISFTEKMETK